ncbi:MAG TPA: sulfur transferase domain-containing protein [Gemmatimonadaceae bacterium]|nr:sulfur transferase domain-containing protein [Gemmatimonadaceae bacterium]
MKKTAVLVATVLLTVAAPLPAQRFTQAGTIRLTAPVLLDTIGLFQARFARVGDDVFIAGQPTEKGLGTVHDRGVTTVVNLRSPQEMARIPFDEAKVVEKLGMKYVYIPMRGTPDFPYSPAALDTFAKVMKSANGKVLLHCTIAWRASHLWAAYLIRERGIPVKDALDNARAINLMDDMRMEDQPIEHFLGRPVPGIGHPGGK